MDTNPDDAKVKKSKSTKSVDRKYWVFGLRIASDFGATIAIPVCVFVYFGRKLDAGSGYKFTVLAFVLAALLSGAIIYRKARKYGEEYTKIDDTN